MDRMTNTRTEIQAADAMVDYGPLVTMMPSAVPPGVGVALVVSAWLLVYALIHIRSQRDCYLSRIL